MFLNQVKNIFALQTPILLLKRMFPSLATQGNMFGNNVSATMFPSLARPYQNAGGYPSQGYLQGDGGGMVMLLVAPWHRNWI